jgi:IS5 family transposase
MAQSGCVPHDACRSADLLRWEGRHRLELDVARQCQRKSTKRGDLTGPNPTDRAKLGTKRHVLADGQGIPLAVTLTGANVHDMHMVGKTLDAVPVRSSRGPKRPKNICLDKGYDYKKPEKEARARRVRPHIRRRGENPLTGSMRGKKPRRWVVERTNSWHNNFRALRIRWEKISDNYLALVQMACALIIFQAAERS